MRIVAFIIEPTTVRAILDHLGEPIRPTYPRTGSRLAIPAHIMDRTLAQFPHRSSRTVVCTRLKVLRGPKLIRTAA